MPKINKSSPIVQQFFDLESKTSVVGSGSEADSEDDGEVVLPNIDPKSGSSRGLTSTTVASTSKRGGKGKSIPLKRVKKSSDPNFDFEINIPVSTGDKIENRMKFGKSFVNIFKLKFLFNYYFFLFI